MCGKRFVFGVGVCHVAFGFNRVPEAEHEEAWLPDPSRPGYGFHCDFSDTAVFGSVSSMNDIAIIMVVSGEDELYITDFFDDFA